MDERRANIDIAFRNGLKDFEVLPPPEVWDSIQHNIKRKQSPVYLLRAAALIGIVMTMSVLAYRWSNYISTKPDNTVISYNEEESPLLNSGDIGIPVSVTNNVIKVIRDSQYALIENRTGISALTVENNAISKVDFLPESSTLLPDDTASLNVVHHHINVFGSQSNTLNLNEIDQEYLTVDNPVKGTYRWSVAALASPTYYGKISSGSDDLSRQVMAAEQPSISYSGGVALSYKVNKRFSIQSGLFYSSVGQEIDGIKSFGGFKNYDYTKGDHNFEIRTSNGTVFTKNSDVFLLANGNDDRIISNYSNDVFDPQKASLEYINSTMRQSFSYLELPIILRYKLVDRTIDFNLIGGISYNLLVNNSVYTLTDEGKYPIGTTEGLNIFSISSSLGMGMEYKFSEKFSLNLEPTFRYYMNPYNDNTGSHIHPYSFGIFSGVSYKF